VATPKDHDEDSSREIALAARAIDAGNYVDGLALATHVIEKEFDNPLALYLAGMAMYRTQRNGMAYNLFQRASELDPNRPEPWNMMGVCRENTWQLDQAEACFRESLKRHPLGTEAMENMALVEINRCRPDESLKWSDRATKAGSTTAENTENRAMALLMKGDWSGWKYYRESAGGTKQRTLKTYNDPEEPMWEGQPGTVVIYGNQGIGDEIAFASCIPDAAKNNKIILDCDERVEGLFRRSFPGVKVYGTRHKESRDWDHLVDYSLPVDCLPSMFRLKDEDFPGTPYLVADPERRLQWRSLFDSYKKPVIGISWSGGTTLTGSGKRSVSLEKLLPLFKSIDAVWVSLEYKDRREKIKEFQQETGIEIKDFSRAVHVQDYDETAALVAEVDLVVSVTTAVVHLAGALGKECLCLAPSKARWFYGMEKDTLPWYRSVKIFRQPNGQDWHQPIEQIRRVLKDRYGDWHLRGAANSGS
jgi:Tfp pilus assembly protein PilF